MTSITVGYM